ncbi:MAG TPA: galactokinase [Ktedonobacteraceae bacterium]|nr:galactokinase [Ktedonobacteraceae bacterium]
MRQTEQRAAQAYRECFHQEPALIASAPGRINLIGEHTDYNGGFVLPCAVSRRVAIALGPNPADPDSVGADLSRPSPIDRPPVEDEPLPDILVNDHYRPPESQLYSADFHEQRPLTIQKAELWADYPSGIVWALKERGHTLPAFQGAFAGDVPLGSGLSSSAAIEAATVLALNEFFALDIARKDLAVLCQRAENGFVGVNSGIMDQYASLLCREGMALLIDCRTLEAQQVPLELASAGLTLLVCDTQVSRKLGDTGYNARRQTCEQAASMLGVKQLRDAKVSDLDRLFGEELRRARHVVTENERVLQAVDALKRQNFTRFGQLMYESHRSMRDDYEISTPELDTFVELAAASGAVGARLTGAGFGGCAIALMKPADVEELKSRVLQHFAARGFKEPAFYVFQPAEGAEVVQQA